ncbi:DNA alkylation repair protein [Rhizobium sp. L1K21]|uniref:DNA alkylation repair protein n=1 Tax=Rhizobium sp. L1K21 TaxID=2954933 RepID=UPI0020920BBE|nr:DNA alkylation repair protein [Rhizobium sp. L1K21]MCO6184824.1 DNA alkylation repair protein [Rhizobium sp. L1K21]
MEPLKNLFSPKLTQNMARNIARHAQGFDQTGFEADVMEKLEALELKPRAQWITDCLHQYLPPDWTTRERILRASLHPLSNSSPEQPTDGDGIRGWAIMPLTMLIGQHHIAHFDEAMALLYEMTRRFTSEFAVRYFLLEDQARALAIMESWLDDEDEHIRRLISEGTRPRLPWAMQLPALMADPTPAIPLLKHLRDDPSEYVRRSVANHLNDIAKDHPDLVADIAADWLKEAPPERQKLLRHACRTLIKQGHGPTLKAFNFEPPAIGAVEINIETPTVNFGEALNFTAAIASKSNSPQAVIIDYAIHFVKADGKRKPKVFKWTKATLEPGKPLHLKRRHPIREITTRQYYTGKQAVSLRINGEDFGSEEFELIMPDTLP